MASRTLLKVWSMVCECSEKRTDGAPLVGDKGRSGDFQTKGRSDSHGSRRTRQAGGRASSCSTERLGWPRGSPGGPSWGRGGLSHPLAPGPGQAGDSPGQAGSVGGRGPEAKLEEGGQTGEGEPANG